MSTIAGIGLTHNVKQSRLKPSLTALVYMKTLQQLSDTLRNRIKRLGFTQEALGSAAGVSRQTLSKVLSGRSDLKVTTLMALADRLGLEMMLVPKEIAPGMEPRDESGPRVKSVVDVALGSIRPEQRRDDKKTP